MAPRGTFLASYKLAPISYLTCNPTLVLLLQYQVGTRVCQQPIKGSRGEECVVGTDALVVEVLVLKVSVEG